MADHVYLLGYSRNKEIATSHCSFLTFRTWMGFLSDFFAHTLRTAWRSNVYKTWMAFLSDFFVQTPRTTWCSVVYKTWMTFLSDFFVHTLHTTWRTVVYKTWIAFLSDFFVHTQRTTWRMVVYIDYWPVWGLLRLAPISQKSQKYPICYVSLIKPVFQIYS